MKTTASDTPNDDVARSLTLHNLRQACADAEADLNLAEQRVRHANAKARRLAFRLHSTSFNLPPWVAALILGSVAALLPSILLILTGRASVVALLIFCIVGYAMIGVGVYVIVCDEPGESDGSRRDIRLQKLTAARLQRDAEMAAGQVIEEELRVRRRALNDFIVAATGAIGGRLFTLVLVPHARQPWDEGSFWIVPGRCSVQATNAIANGNRVTSASRILGPAKWVMVNEAATNLATALESAGIKVIIETVPDDRTPV